MAAAITSLDIEGRQILLYFENDDIPWHHRVLTLQIEGPKWICAPPDLEVQSVNLINKDIRLLARNAEIPVDCRQVYMFDPIGDADMQSIRTESRRLAEVLGVAGKLPTSCRQRWRTTPTGSSPTRRTSRSARWCPTGSWLGRRGSS